MIFKSRKKILEIGDLSFLPSSFHHAYRLCLSLVLKSRFSYRAAINFTSQLKHDGSLLDLGSGSAEHLKKILQVKPNWKTIIAADRAEVVATLKKDPTLLKLNISPQVIDFDNIPQLGPDTLVTCFSAFHHFDEGLKASIYSQCKSNGYSLLVVEPFKRSYCELFRLILITPLAVLIGGLTPLYRPNLSVLFWCLLFPLVPMAVHIDAILSWWNLDDPKSFPVWDESGEHFWYWRFKDEC